MAIKYNRAYLTKDGLMTSHYDVAKKHGIKAKRTFRWVIGHWKLVKRKSYGRWA